MSGPKRGASESRALNKALGKSRSKKRTQNKISYTDFGSGHSALVKSTSWFADANNSNSTDWKNDLSPDELKSLKWYTGNGFTSINKDLYTKDWKNISDSMKETINNMEKGLDKSVLLNGMTVTRACDFKIFGAPSGKHMTVDQIKDFIKNNAKNGVLENKGFLSAGANNHGAEIDGSGLVIHIDVPPSIGAGAYVNPISVHSGSSENEFLFNRNSRFKFDTGSIKKDAYGNIHIRATWVGRGKGKK